MNVGYKCLCYPAVPARALPCASRLRWSPPLAQPPSSPQLWLPRSALMPQGSADFMHEADVESFALPCSPGLGAALTHPRLQQLPHLVTLPLTRSLPLPQSRVSPLQRSPHASAAGPAKRVMFGFLSDTVMLISQRCCCLQVLTGTWACLSSALQPCST